MPAPKPAFDTELDSGNSLTTNIVWASWFAEDEANPTRLTDVSGNGNHGTLIGLDPDSEMIVTGGTGGNAVYNQTYSPAGNEYGKTKYISADGLYKLSFWYMMDPGMDGYWFLWGASSVEPGMDGYVAYKTGNVAANVGAYTSTSPDAFAVAQGDLAPGPWFDDGLQFGGGHVEIGNTGNQYQPGTGNFTLVFDYTPGPVPTGADALLYWSTSSGDAGYSEPCIEVGRWSSPGDDWYNGIARMDYRDGDGNIVWPAFPGTGAAWQRNTRVVVIYAADRDGNLTLYINGSAVGTADITSLTGSFTDMAVLNIGNSGTDREFMGRLHAFLYYQSRCLNATEAAAVSADIYALAAASGETAVALAGEVTGTATSAGQLSLVAGLAGAATGTATSSGQLGLVVDLAGAATGDAASAADLTAVEAGVEELAGTATGNATSAGQLSLVAGLAGSATGTSTSAGQLSLAVGLGGTAAGEATSSGSLIVAVPPDIVRWNTIRLGTDGTNYFQGSIDEFVMDANVRVLDDFPIVKDVSGPNDCIFWPFAENAGLFVFSGRILGETLELHGGTWTTGRTRYGVSFDGVDDYGVCTPTAESFAGRTLSVEVGIKFLADVATPILTQDGGINLSYDGNGGIVAALGGVTNPTSVVGRLTAQNEWTNVCLVYDGSQKELWVNNQKTGTVASTGTAQLTNNPLYVAKDGNTYGNVVIDRIRIYRGRLRPYTRTVKRFMPGQSSFAANADWIME